MYKDNFFFRNCFDFEIPFIFCNFKFQISAAMKKIFVLLFSALTIVATAQQEARLLRFPSVNGNQVVFSYAGDLYAVALSGGLARKLTSHPGTETFSRFSPDGKWLAFTGQYDGNSEIYLMSSQGGEPKRITYTPSLERDDLSDRMGPNNIVMSWTNDGKSIVYRSRKMTWNDWEGQLFQVPVSGGLSKQIPLPAGGFHSWSPDGKKLAYNRVMREFRTWKYYKGGMADEVWIYDTVTQKTENITGNVAQDIFPMWIGKEIYFISDRDRTMNLFCYHTETRVTKKVTDFTEYDIKFPSHDGNGIVFENGGWLYYFDVKTQSSSKINIHIANDMQTKTRELKDASKHLQSFTLSPEGDFIAAGARGDIFVVPARDSRTINLTQSSGSHDRAPVVSPDGKQIAFLSDKSGEYEIYLQKADGSEPAVAVTSGSTNYIFEMKWSPDGKKILFSNREMKLLILDITTKKVTPIAQSTTWEIRDYNWSPDSKWVAFSDRKKQGLMQQIFLYSVESGKTTAVTDTWFSSGSPVFSSDGRYLLFTSQRDFNPTYSQTEWNHSYQNMTRIYMIALNASSPVPFGPYHDDLMKNPPAAKTDTQQLSRRIIDLPVAPGEYWNIAMTENLIYYNSRTAADPSAKLRVFDMKEKKENALGEYGYKMSQNGKKMLIQKDNKFYIIDRPDKDIKTEKETRADMWVQVRLEEEWKQIYMEAWRQMRDFFYAPNMHGTDWTAMRNKYAALLPWVRSRDDLNYLIGEMIGELNVGHAYVGGGDKYQPERIYTGMLGAEISKDPSGFFRIDKILRGRAWDKNLISPLAAPGLNVKEGDLITAVNKTPVKDLSDLYELLQNQAGKQVELTLSSSAAGTPAREVIVIPLKYENDLYYYNMIQKNIEYVNMKTGGKVGYIHIPDMGVEGLNEFVKHFYPQLDKEALIIDDRGNGGGNVSPMITERLRREIAIMGMSRNAAEGKSSPGEIMPGPLVLLVNKYSASDGDLFPYRFRYHKLGTIIGTRTWGGVVGIRGSLPFVDGAYLNRPEFAHYAADGSGWIIEGHGIDPDIVIENDPALEFSGVDQQLDKAIEVIMEELKQRGYKKSAIPEYPDKTK